MSTQLNIQDELRKLESRLPHNNNRAFSVPEGYFDGLAASVLAKVRAGEHSVSSELQEISPLLAGLSKKMPYSVPFSYFEETTAGVPGHIAQTESAILDSINKAQIYTVPPGYFNNLPTEILSRVATPKAKVIPLFARTWMRAASAAIVGGALFIAGSQYFGKEERLVTELATNTPFIEQEIKKVSTKDLEEFVQNVQVNVGKEKKVATTLPEIDRTSELLKDVSEAEMESFLSVMPTAYDDLIVTD